MTAPSPTDAPDDMQEAVALLQAEGYTENFNIVGSCVPCPKCGTEHAPSQLLVDRFFRFEGESDPADESIVFAVRCPSCGAKGVLVSPYGPDADPEVMQQLTLLTRNG